MQSSPLLVIVLFLIIAVGALATALVARVRGGDAAAFVPEKNRPGYLLGPFCHDGVCFTGEAGQMCQAIGGFSIGDGVCYVSTPHVIYGPFCPGGTCNAAATKQFCDEKKGAVVADRWCVVKANLFDTAVSP